MARGDRHHSEVSSEPETTFEELEGDFYNLVAKYKNVKDINKELRAEIESMPIARKHCSRCDELQVQCIQLKDLEEIANSKVILFSDELACLNIEMAEALAAPELNKEIDELKKEVSELKVRNSELESKCESHKENVDKFNKGKQSLDTLLFSRGNPRKAGLGYVPPKKATKPNKGKKTQEVASTSYAPQPRNPRNDKHANTLHAPQPRQPRNMKRIVKHVQNIKPKHVNAHNFNVPHVDSSIVCHFCGGRGHMNFACPLKRYPGNSKLVWIPKGLLTSLTNSSGPKTVWVPQKST